MRGLLRKVRDRAGKVLRPRREGDLEATRWKLTKRYIRGDGLEIGALNLPLALPEGASVRYVDRLPLPELRRQYPELAGKKLVVPDIIDNGEVLGKVSDQSVDFVIANHLIEHTENPIATIKNHLRVLRPGGVLYLAVPDKRHTFDRDRPVTSIAHLWRDYREGPDWSRRDHFVEWVRLMEKAPDDKVPARVAKLMKTNYSIHFHVWTKDGFTKFLRHLKRALRFPFTIEATKPNGHEFIVILRKTS